MAWIDWAMVVAYFLFMLAIGLGVRKIAGKDTESYFAASRSLPWWLTAASLIATSFGADTPMWVTGIVRQFGIQGAWQFWTYFIGIGLAVFLFARYWRRIGVVTDLQVISMRYDGKVAQWYRGLAAAFACAITLSVILGACVRTTDTLLRGMFDMTDQQRMLAVIGIMVITTVYSAYSGLLGVVLTDFVQLIIAVVGSSVLAFIVVNKLGGVQSMADQLSALPNWPGHTLSISPQMGELNRTPPGTLPIWNALAFVGFLWWAVTVAGSYIAQRLLSTKTQAQASKAMLAYGVFYWGLNAWPWIIVAAGSLLLLDPTQLSASGEDAYVRMIREYSPTGVRGLMFVAMLSALMSTVSSMLNWGASYFVNDLYRPYFHPNASERHYVIASQITTGAALVVGVTIGLQAGSIRELGYITAGIGLSQCVQTLCRWLWGRMTAWSEIAATVMIIVLTLSICVLRLCDDWVARVLPMYDSQGELQPFSTSFEYFGLRSAVFLVATLVTIVGVSLVTEPASRETIAQFTQKARPVKWGWRGTLRRHGLDYQEIEPWKSVLMGWLLVTVGTYGVLTGTGHLLLARTGSGLVHWAVAAVALTLAWRLIDQLPEVETEQSQPVRNAENEQEISATAKTPASGAASENVNP